MVKIRQDVEKRIARATIKGLLAAGFLITVFDGEEETVQRSRSPKVILGAMMTTDEDYLIVFNPGPSWRGDDGRRAGWVRFVYGNSGWDVINDYTTNLESALTAANDLSEKLSD